MSSDLETYYAEASAEIRLRNETQSRIALAAAAGLGVLLAQVGTIQDKQIYWVYLGAAFIFGALGVYYVEQDRMIATLAQYRARLEQTLSGDLAAAVGWEFFRSGRKKDSGLITTIASLYRYLPTIGSSVALGVAYFILKGADSVDYKAGYGDMALIFAWGTGIICLAVLTVKAQLEFRQIDASNLLKP